MNALAQAVPVSRSLPRWSDAREIIAQTLVETLAEVASREDLSERSLKSVVLLHLPQFTLEEIANKFFLHHEVSRVAHKIKKLQQRFGPWIDRENIPVFNKREFSAAVVTEQIAQDLHRRFHYLHSAHAGENVGIYHRLDTVPAAIATLSPMNVVVLQKYLLPGGADNARLLSRMFAFEWAPRNSISYLLGQAVKWVKQHHPNVDTFLTFVNPNVGFSGSSYRASNWELVGTHPTHYRYFQGTYISARTFYEFHKTNSVIPQISFSQYELEPLEVWAYRIRK